MQAEANHAMGAAESSESCHFRGKELVSTESEVQHLRKELLASEQRYAAAKVEMEAIQNQLAEAEGGTTQGDNVTIQKATPEKSLPIENSLGYARVQANRLKLGGMSDPILLKSVFDEVASEDGLLRFEQFEKALTEKLQLDLSDTEIRRIWMRVSNSDGGDVNFATFTAAFKQVRSREW